MSWLTRFWERVRSASHPDRPRAPDVVHLSTDHNGYPLCGARWGARWALNVEAVTCEECRRDGMLLYIQHWCNTR